MRSIFTETSNNEVVNVRKCRQMLDKNMNCQAFYIFFLQIWRSPVKSINLFFSAVIQLMSHDVCYTIKNFRTKTFVFEITISPRKVGVHGALWPGNLIIKKKENYRFAEKKRKENPPTDAFLSSLKPVF